MQGPATPADTEAEQRSAAVAPAVAERLVRLAHGVIVSALPDGGCRFDGPLRSLVLTGPDGTAQILASGLASWTTPEALFAGIVAARGVAGGAATGAMLDHLRAAGFLEQGIRIGGDLAAQARVYPGSGLAPLNARQTARPAPPFRLVPHASLTPADGGWSLASPLACGEVTIRDRGLLTAVTAGLVSPQTGWSPTTAAERLLSEDLVGAGLLGAWDAPSLGSPLGAPDLWLHARSRRGTARGPVGAVAALKGETDAGTAPMSPHGRLHPLPHPDPAMPDPGFRSVLERRRSVRARQPGALTAGHIGALLWTAARTLSPAQADGQGNLRAARPYPQAGGIAIGDLYLALGPGLGDLPRFAVYDPDRHGLLPIDTDPLPLLQDAAWSMGQPDLPPAVLIVTARFDRLARRYADATYALLLKDAGVQVQTLHLAATSLGIGSCILGGGDSRAFALASELDPLAQGPIAEIALTGTFSPSAVGVSPHVQDP